VQMQVM